VHALHVELLTPHLWPRREDEFLGLAKEGRLIYAEQGDLFVGACYVLDDEDNDDPPEFGGVCVRANIQRNGLGYVLGAVAIGTYVASNMPRPDTKVIAHVHIRNDEKPRRLLEKLGFHFTRQVTVPPDLLPKDHRLDVEPDGSMKGDEYEYDFRKLAQLADRIHDVRGNGPFVMEPAAGPMGWPDILTAMREIAGGKRDLYTKPATRCA
jgi:GNAT superfamily N-acetyltransferase